MAGKELNTSSQVDSFQKDQIMRRLRSRAIQLWGLQEADIENLDPIIDLLMGACAVEFERTAHEIYASQARVLERLAQLMVPEVLTNARPAHAIMHIQAELPVIKLKLEDQFSIEKEFQNSKEGKLAIIFSPVTEGKIFDASVLCQAIGNKITFYENPLVKKEIISALGKKTLPPYSMWLGIKSSTKIENLNGMSFFFDWKNEPDKASILPLLSFTQWSSGEKAVKMNSGLRTKDYKDLAELDLMSEVENHVIHFYKNHFFTINEDISPQKVESFPAELEKVFSADQLKNLKKDLLWIHVRYPEGISQAISEVYCAINCIPVLNRRLHLSNRPFALSAKLNIIPLHTEDHFLTLRKVFSDVREYHSVSFKNIRELEDGNYSIRQGGVARFDQRNASEILNYLHELLRDESAAFSAYGNYALHSEIKSLDQNLKRIEMLLQKQQSLSNYLLLFTKEPEDLWVEFWSTQGETANRIPSGKKLTSLSDMNVKKETLMLLNSSLGGREPLNETEKLHVYKYNLLTRSRIVTEEDIKAACFAELGNKIERVKIKKGIKKDASSEKGFIRTLDIVLSPTQELDEKNWDTTCQELQSFLERKKMFLTEIQVYLEK
ncbi:type VI secretion system baseplate subunit TssF [soil metagenome]